MGVSLSQSGPWVPATWVSEERQVKDPGCPFPGAEVSKVAGWGLEGQVLQEGRGRGGRAAFPGPGLMRRDGQSHSVLCPRLPGEGPQLWPTRSGQGLVN